MAAGVALAVVFAVVPSLVLVLAFVACGEAAGLPDEAPVAQVPLQGLLGLEGVPTHPTDVFLVR